MQKKDKEVQKKEKIHRLPNIARQGKGEDLKKTATLFAILQAHDFIATKVVSIWHVTVWNYFLGRRGRITTTENWTKRTDWQWYWWHQYVEGLLKRQILYI